MATAKIRAISGLNFGQQANGQPLGPSVSGGLLSSSKFLSSQPLPMAPANRKFTRAFSDDSSDSSSLNDDNNQKWPRNAMQILRSRMREAAEGSAIPAKTTSDPSKLSSMWERTKKEPVDDSAIVPSAVSGNKRKSKRHRSLEAKTARYYAKRQQTGWTPQLGRKGSNSSSDDDGGFKMRREMSPRRKRGSREGSRSVSRDASVAPSGAAGVAVASQQQSPRVTRSDRSDLPPSSTGVARRSPAVAPKPILPAEHKAVSVPAIRITTEYDSPSVATPSYPPPSAGGRPSADALTIEEWINARPLSKSGSLAASTQSLASLSRRSDLLDQPPLNNALPTAARQLSHAHSHMEISSIHPTPSRLAERSRASVPVRSPSHVDLSISRSPVTIPSPNSPTAFIGHIQVNGLSSPNSQWNQPMSRYSLPAGIDERGLGFPGKPEPPSPKSVQNKRNFFEQFRKKPTDSGSSEPIKPDNRPPAVEGKRETARHALALTSAKSTELLPIGGHVAADSQFLHHALQTSTNAARLLSDLRTPPSQSGRSTIEEGDPRTAVRWNSDWQLHQSSSGIYRPSSIHHDPSRLNVPSRTRLAPLKETDQKELELALEELDEFYESISTKSEDVTLKSPTGLRSDSGVSSPRQVPAATVVADLTKKNLQEKDRQEYTKQWIHQGATGQAPRDAFRRPDAGGSRRRGQSLGEVNFDRRTPSEPGRASTDDLAYRKRDGQTPPKKSPSDLPNPSYLLMSVAYTPTVFTGSALEFPNYPGTNRPQPHVEMDDLSVRKIIHSQNTPYFRVTTDLPKQLHSTRNDYAVPNFGVPKSPSKGPDSVRDDAAFRQLRSDQKQQKDRPQTLAIPPEKKPETKIRSISNSIKNLAKQFEGHKEEPKVPAGCVGKAAVPSKNILHAAVQINGQKVAARSPYTSTKSLHNVNAPAKTPDVAAQKTSTNRVSPKVSPMDDKQMDDLLLSLSSLSSVQVKKSPNAFRRPFSPNQKKSNDGSTGLATKLFGAPSRTNIAMAV